MVGGGDIVLGKGKEVLYTEVDQVIHLSKLRILSCNSHCLRVIIPCIDGYLTILCLFCSLECLIHHIIPEIRVVEGGETEEVELPGCYQLERDHLPRELPQWRGFRFR